MKVLKHIVFTTLLVFLLIGIPILTNLNNLITLNDTDLNSGGSVIIESPSGNYKVYINEEYHKEDLSDWILFANGDPDVILWDKAQILTIKGDTLGVTLASRYSSQFPGLFTIKNDVGILIASRIEAKLFDVAVVSAEVFDFYHLKNEIEGVTLIDVLGEEL